MKPYRRVFCGDPFVDDFDREWLPLEISRFPERYSEGSVWPMLGHVGSLGISKSLRWG